MNANGLARAYIAKGMNTRDFLNYVVDCVNRELREWEIEGQVTHQWNSKKRGTLLISYHSLSTTVYFDLSLLSKFQQAGPYALDRLIWRLFENQGLPVPKDHYIETVLNENFDFPESIPS
ncbi:hypothetical protein RZN22_03375 [Bacillaceae bacterium S4-13-58]